MINIKFEQGSPKKNFVEDDDNYDDDDDDGDDGDDGDDDDDDDDDDDGIECLQCRPGPGGPHHCITFSPAGHLHSDFTSLDLKPTNLI